MFYLPVDLYDFNYITPIGKLLQLWIEGQLGGFTSLSAVFQSCQDNDDYEGF